MSEFVPFPKIARFSREVIVTEKIDGTNAQVFIRQFSADEVMPTETPIVAVRGDLLIYAGSRTRWITPKDDNFHFAAFVERNADELAQLGPGSHFGEWWGSGIQRTYGLKERRFSLFNVGRWGDAREAKCVKCHLPASTWAPLKCDRCQAERPAEPPKRPACCHVVPELWRGLLDDFVPEGVVANLEKFGSQAAPGFDKPEGIVIFHVASGQLFKKTVDKDHEPKGKAVAA
jgi:hypothetical protein